MMLRKLGFVLAVVALGLGSVQTEALARVGGSHSAGGGRHSAGGFGGHSGGRLASARRSGGNFHARVGGRPGVAQRGFNSDHTGGCYNSWPDHDDYSDNDGFGNSC
jgi:hypothetical protein